jgi:hypothetical protein
MDALGSLRRYYVTATTMQSSFRAFVAAHPEGPESQDGSLFPQFIAHLSVWYATLFTAWEGWRELGLGDPELDRAWERPYRHRLQGFRDATLHYRAEHFDKELTEFAGTPESAAFVLGVHLALGKAIAAQPER